MSITEEQWEKRLNGMRFMNNNFTILMSIVIICNMIVFILFIMRWDYLMLLVVIILPFTTTGISIMYITFLKKRFEYLLKMKFSEYQEQVQKESQFHKDNKKFLIPRIVIEYTITIIIFVYIFITLFSTLTPLLFSLYTAFYSIVAGIFINRNHEYYYRRNVVFMGGEYKELVKTESKSWLAIGIVYLVIAIVYYLMVLL